MNVEVRTIYEFILLGSLVALANEADFGSAITTIPPYDTTDFTSSSNTTPSVGQRLHYSFPAADSSASYP